MRAKQWADQFCQGLAGLQGIARHFAIPDKLDGSPQELLTAFREVYRAVTGSDHPNLLEPSVTQLRNRLTAEAGSVAQQVAHTMREAQRRAAAMVVAGADEENIAVDDLGPRVVAMPPVVGGAIVIPYAAVPPEHRLARLVAEENCPLFAIMPGRPEPVIVLGSTSPAGRRPAWFAVDDIRQTTRLVREYRQAEAAKRQAEERERQKRIQEQRERDPAYRERQQADRIASLEAQVSRLTAEPRA